MAILIMKSKSGNLGATQTKTEKISVYSYRTMAAYQTFVAYMIRLIYLEHSNNIVSSLRFQILANSSLEYSASSGLNAPIFFKSTHTFIRTYFLCLLLQFTRYSNSDLSISGNHSPQQPPTRSPCFGSSPTGRTSSIRPRIQ